MAQVTFNLSGGIGTNLPSYSFSSGGVNLTVSTTVAPNSPVSPQSFVSYTTTGVCIFANATSATRCALPSFPSTYNNLSFIFTSEVFLRSFNVSQTITATSNFGNLNVLFKNSSIGTSNTIIGNGTAINRVNFTSAIYVPANTAIVFNIASGPINSSCRIDDLVVDTISTSRTLGGRLGLYGI